MNSILQCLSNTRELRDYCLQRLYMRDLGHTSSAHTALMEGEEPVWVGVAPPPFSALPYPYPSSFLSLPVLGWGSSFRICC